MFNLSNGDRDCANCDRHRTVVKPCKHGHAALKDEVAEARATQISADLIHTPGTATKQTRAGMVPRLASQAFATRRLGDIATNVGRQLKPKHPVSVRGSLQRQTRSQDRTVGHYIVRSRTPCSCTLRVSNSELVSADSPCNRRGPRHHEMAMGKGADERYHRRPEAADQPPSGCAASGNLKPLCVTHHHLLFIATLSAPAHTTK